MGTFGERLRREREMRNISLEEIAAVTKIGTRLLRALEDEQFDQLPGGIFNKGYVRAYAKYVGIDEEQAVADYLQAAHEAAADEHGSAEQNSASRFEKAAASNLSPRGARRFPLFPCLSFSHSFQEVWAAGVFTGSVNLIDSDPRPQCMISLSALPQQTCPLQESRLCLRPVLTRLTMEEQMSSAA